MRTAYIIKETREFYGPKKETATICDYFGEPETFACKEAALQRIAELDDASYKMAHNESCRPSYRAVKA